LVYLAKGYTGNALSTVAVEMSVDKAMVEALRPVKPAVARVCIVFVQ